MNDVLLGTEKIDKKVVAIVMFGPATPTSGMRPAEYYQVTIDPCLVSPSGEYIRFGMHKGDEIIGWQRVSSLTLCEVLTDWPKDGDPQIPMTTGSVEIRSIVHEDKP